jgi:hypothetical protein
VSFALRKKRDGVASETVAKDDMITPIEIRIFAKRKSQTIMGNQSLKRSWKRRDQREYVLGLRN